MSTHVAVQQRARRTAKLPSPPTDEQKIWYMGRQHRWLLIAQAVSFALIAYSIFRFATADSRLLLFLLPMSLYGLTLLVSLASSSRTKRTSLVGHRALVETWNPDFVPSIDVFLPSAGESLDLLANTYSHVAGLTWPGQLTVHVLDDSGRQDVADLAADFGFTYHTRPDRGRLKKAGNLRYGLMHSTGDFVLILDADFVPRYDALYDVMPYFEDPNIGIVQTPQFFDTDRRMGWLQRCAGATQELFYRWIQPSRDASKAAICVGTCAVYRRAALNRAGGFAQIGHSEDVHTGVNLMKAGFEVRYVPVLIAKGLCPDNVASFLNQQYRWCSGSMSLLADRSFHNAQHISFRQRLCFWSGFLYYISTGLNAFVAPLPALAMLYALPKWIEPKNSVWLLGVLVLWFAILPTVMKSRWRVQVLRVQVLYSFAHAVAIFDVLTGRTQEWVATGAAAGGTPTSVRIGRLAKLYLSLSYSALWVGLIHGILTYGLGKFWAMLALAALASYLHAPLLLIPTRHRPTVHVPPAQQLLPPRQQQSLPTAPPTPTATASPAPVAPRDMVPEAAGPRRFRPDIQGLRAVAVLLVVLYHAQVPKITGGYVGVDVFFVISGFLITGQLMREVGRNGRISFAAFYVNRMRRLVPPAAVMLLTSVLVARKFGSPFQFASIGTDAITVATYVFNYRLAIAGVNYQNANGPLSPLQHCWSLAVEEQFYVVWPFLLMVCVWLARRHARAAVTLALALVFGVSLYLSVTVSATDGPLAYFSLQTRAWELAAGALISMAATRLSRQPRWTAVAGSWTGLALIVGTALTYTDSTLFPGSAAVVPTLGAALVIIAGCRANPAGRSGSAEGVLGRWPMQGMGAVSYSWYLWHWPILILAPFVFGHSFGWGGQLELMVIALWVATLSYWMIESPTRRTRLRLAVWGAGGLGLSGLVVGLAVLLIATQPPLIGSGAAAIPVSLSRNGLAQVQRAVGLATEITSAPSNLTPSLDRAHQDQPVTSHNGCHLDYTKVDPPTCVYGDRVAPVHTAVLLGDSHAQQWLPALDKAARDHRWRLIAWTKAACPYADVTVFNSILHRAFTECDTWRAKITDRVKLMSPDLVIVSQSNSVPGTSVTNPTWANQTAVQIAKLQAAHIPVVYLGDTPYHGVNVPDCVARHLNDVGSCTIKRAYIEPYRGRAELLQQTLTATHVTYLDPTNWFCTLRDCPPIVGNLLVYRDESHISTAYSYYLAPLLSSIFTS